MPEYEYEKRQSHLCFSTEISSQAEVYRIPIWSQMVTGEWEIWLAFNHLMCSAAHCFSGLLPRITEDPRRGGLKKHWFIIPHDSVGWLGFISCVCLGSVVQLHSAGTSSDRGGFRPLSTRSFLGVKTSDFQEGKRKLLYLLRLGL